MDTAVNSTKFYSQLKSYKTLSDFPVVNKHTIKNNFEDINILSTSSHNLIEVRSSGSTGMPFKIYHTKRKARRNKADVIYFANSVGYTIGDQLIFIRFWNKFRKKPLLVTKAFNFIPVHVEDDLKDDKIKSLISKIRNDKQPKGFIGYPSGFEKICNYLDKIKSAPLECNVQSIIATSESLNDNVREKMEYYFKNPVVSRYSNEENGIISQQMINDNFHTINWASYYIEILDINEDKQAKLGEIGRIVVTDLYNLATPMIRYDTGDLGKLCHYKNDKIPKFDIVHGRKKDILYNTKGEIVNSFVVYNSMIEYSDIIQLQIIQIGKYEYILIINCKSKLAKENELTNYFKSYLGSDAIISVEYTDEIPLLNSGKRRVIVNLYKP